jgi:DNA-cytosine methyltransferase
MIKLGSLFSGIGGFELGVEYALNSVGIETQVCWQVEIDPFCQQVLQKHWPNTRRYSDITTLNPAELEPVDLVIGGFPCQDISQAGFGEGINGSRSGLFYELMRIIRRVEPPFILLENVPAITISNRGLGSVLGELANAGFDVQWESISAADCGAPHKRSRWFALANSNKRFLECPETPQTKFNRKSKNSSRRKKTWIKYRRCDPLGETRKKQKVESCMGGNLNGISPRLDLFKFPKGRGLSQFDWEPPRLHKRQPNDSKRIKALGNSIVPAQAALAVDVLGLIPLILK